MANPLPKSFVVDPPEFQGVPTSKLPKSFVADAPKEFRYDVPPPVSTETPEQKAARIAADDAQFQEKARKANSFGGILGNTLKGVGEVVASSEIGLGKTMAKVIGSKKELNTYLETLQTYENSKVQLIKQIRDKESRGEDATQLKQIYNDTADKAAQTKKVIDDYSGTIPTTSQALGQIGGVALDVLTAGTYGKGATATMKTGELATKPAISATAKSVTPFGKVMSAAEKTSSVVAPEATKVVEIASKPTGLFTKKGAASVAKGATVGYANDVTQGLQGNRGEDRTGTDAFIPGLGTALGAGLPALTQTMQSFKNQFGKTGRLQRIVDDRQKELNKLDSYASVEKVVQKAKDKGFDVKEFVSNSDLLHKSVDKSGTISTKGEGQAIEKVQNFINKNGEDVVNKILEKEGVSIDPATLETQLKKSVMNSGLQGSNLTKALREVESDMSGYAMRADKDGRIPLQVIHSAKVDKYSNINFMTDPSTQKTAKVIAKTLKELVENETKSADVKSLNKELSQYYTVIDYLEKLDGKKVDGGKLGKYFAKTVGAMVGGHFGAIGAVVGAEAAGKVKGESMARTFGGKTGKNLNSSQMMQDAIAESKKPRLMLPAPLRGAPRSVQYNTKAIPVAPKGSAIEIVGKKGIGDYTP